MPGPDARKVLQLKIADPTITVLPEVGYLKADTEPSRQILSFGVSESHSHKKLCSHRNMCVGVTYHYSDAGNDTG
jgi:hypothetical protein